MNGFTVCLVAAVLAACVYHAESGAYDKRSSSGSNQYGSKGSYQANKQKGYSAASNGYSNQNPYVSNGKNGDSSESTFPEAQLYRGRFTGKV